MSAHRLLVITYHFGSNGAVGGLRWRGITKYLVRLGWEVRVITAAPPEHASVESCPRFWTILDACRLLRRLAVRQSLASLDRKSTRLNSSHTVISYAVFCLKKKKIRKGTQSISTRYDGHFLKKAVEVQVVIA